MPLLDPTGRRSPKGRLGLALLYGLLLAGAVTMVYPFARMLAGSTASGVDEGDHALVPSFLRTDVALYRKYTEALFNESLRTMQAVYDSDALSFRRLEPPAPVAPRALEDWEAFLRDRPPPPAASALGFVYAPVSKGVLPSELRAFRKALRRRFDGDLRRLNRVLRTEFASWSSFYVLPEDGLLRLQAPEEPPFRHAFRAFAARRPGPRHYYFSLEGFYKRAYLMSRYTSDLAAYNAQHGTAYASWAEVGLPARRPEPPAATPAETADWEAFVRGVLHLGWLRADPEAAPAYRAYLLARYGGDLLAFNRDYGTQYTSFDVVPLMEDPRAARGLPYADWDFFVQGWRDPDTGQFHQLDARRITLRGLDFDFRGFLQERYASLDALNAAWQTAFADWRQVRPPQQAWHFRDFQQRVSAIRGEFVTRNYRSVLDFVLLHGRALVNTAIYCALAVLLALLVNPLAAYALSRYRPRSTYLLLLFLLLTMAFPPMVTQIPVFLMLREWHLLNTFWALVLPGVANGYSIFLLKGFFDSLPQELYESAALDGAGEGRMFWQIAMSLSKPILAVTALNAFTLAYSNFMMALLICQDERMWTIMPWLYQLQQRSGAGVVYASLLLAALPTFLVFLFCQNIILRGIVVPVEK